MAVQAVFRFPRSLTAAAGTALLAVAAPAMAACPVGTYDAVGWNPGAPADAAPGYTARVTITERGADVCTIDWQLGAQTFAAVALYDARTDQLHGSYANLDDGWFGIISYRHEGNRWVGEWAIYNTGNNLRGREVLTRR